jgi:hypothetical protein
MRLSLFLLALATESPVKNQLPISLKEARKIMGKDAQKLTDAQLQKLISDLDMIASLQLEIVPNAQ